MAARDDAGARKAQHEKEVRDLQTQVEVTDNQVRLGDDAQMQPALSRKDFQDGARAFEAPLRRLVRIGGGSDGDMVLAVGPGTTWTYERSDKSSSSRDTQ